MTRLEAILSSVSNFFLQFCTVVGIAVVLFTGVYVFSAFAATGKLLGYRTTDGAFLKHDNLETYGGYVLLNDITLKTVLGGYQRVNNVNVSPWDISIEVNSSVDTHQYIHAKIIPRFGSRILRDMFVDADRITLTVNSEKEAELLRGQILECGRVRMLERLK